MGSVVTEAMVFVLMACMKGLAESGEVTLAVAIMVDMKVVMPPVDTVFGSPLCFGEEVMAAARP